MPFPFTDFMLLVHGFDIFRNSKPPTIQTPVEGAVFVDSLETNAVRRRLPHRKPWRWLLILSLDVLEVNLNNTEGIFHERLKHMVF